MSFLNTVIRSSKNIYGTYSVTHSIDTETVDGSSGQVTNSYATAVSLNCAFFKHADSESREIKGSFETGDASLLVVYDYSISRNDKIIITFSDSSTETYIVEHTEPPVGTKCKVVILEFKE